MSDEPKEWINDWIAPVLHDEYVIVYDGDPRMDGTHERCQTSAAFPDLEQAQRALAIVWDRSLRAPKPNLRIEHRRVTPWVTVPTTPEGDR